MSLGCLLLLFAQARQPSAADSLRVLARAAPDSVLAAAASQAPLPLREALSELLATAARRPDSAGVELTAARRLAAAYARAWRDSFLLRQVDRFESWTPERRVTRVRADSLRRAGVAAFAQRGPPAAIALWRQSLRRSASLADTAGMAATLGNLGAAFARQGKADSAFKYLDRARRLAQAGGDLRVEANALGELAGLAEARGDLAAARAGYSQSLALRERIGDSRGLAADYNNLGALAQSLGDFAEARRQLEAALALNRKEAREDVAATNLVNLAGLASLEGDFARAESFYREAQGVWQAQEAWTDLADARRGLGLLEQRRGDYPAARQELAAALALYERSGLAREALEVRQELASTLAAMGDLQGALDGLREAERRAELGHATALVRAGIALARAELSVQLNAHAAAEQLYGSAATLYRQAGSRRAVAEAQEGLARLWLDRSEPARARPLLLAALRAQLAAGDRRSAALTRLTLGQLWLQSGDTTTARRTLAQAAAELARLGDPVAAAAALGERAALEAEAHSPANAEALYRAALASLGNRTAPEISWRLHAGLGRVRRQLGAAEDAARELRIAIADIERSSRSLTLAERRSAFLTDKWGVYAELAFLEQERGRAAAAFEVSERVRAREMIELLGHGRLGAATDTAAELVAREQDLRRRIGELTRRLEPSAIGHESLRGPDVSDGAGATREALVRSQEAYGDLLLEIQERAPRHAALVQPSPVSWRSVAQRLAADEAFVEYLLADAGALAFVLTRDTVATVALGVTGRELASLVDFARGTLEPRGEPRLDSLWRAPLTQLHRYLIAPLEEAHLLAGKSRLTIVPHAELHYLPFAALIDGASGRFLVERFALTVTPSAAAWLALSDRRAGAPGVAGVLALAPRPDVLPATVEEIGSIERLSGAPRVLRGGAATEAAFRQEASSRRILHLASYGVLNKQNPLFSYVELAPGDGQDGRLEVHEVFGLKLAADLVVLSACQTGLGSGALSDVPAGDDWIGLVRAFLHAGATRVVASLWPVRDRATATLMERFYQRLGAGARVSDALASAQRALLAAPATAHPYFWAGFELAGVR